MSYSVPILLSYSLTDEGQLKHHQTLTVGGNVLDIGVGPALWEIVVSIDTVHRPGSMTSLHPDEVPRTDYFETFELFSNMHEDTGVQDIPSAVSPEADLRWERSSLAMLLNNTASKVKKGGLPSETLEKDKSKSKSNFSPAGEILYGLENLRKKRGQAAVEAEQEEADEEEIVPPEVEGIP
jgi:hypothetical protein